TGKSLEGIPPGSAVELVVSSAAHDRVVSTEPVDDIALIVGDERVPEPGPGHALDGAELVSLRPPTMLQLESEVHIDCGRRPAVVDDVLSAATVDRFRAAVEDEPVVKPSAGHDIVASIRRVLVAQAIGIRD